MTRRLAWTCDGCGLPVEDRQGWVTIDLEEVRSVEAADAAWHEAHPGPCYSGAGGLSMPGAVPWHVYHRSCESRPGRLVERLLVASYGQDDSTQAFSYRALDALDQWGHRFGDNWPPKAVPTDEQQDPEDFDNDPAF